MVAHGNRSFLGMDVGGSQLFFLAASERIVLQFDMGGVPYAENTAAS